MRFLKNYRDWVQDQWIEEILSKDGQARPRDWPPSFKIEAEEYLKASDAGYNLDAVYWWVYEKQDVSFEINPPWIKDNDYHWWITKMTPGQMMPMHTDPHTHERPCRRYWVPFDHWQPGHIFLIDDVMIGCYGKGDVFQYDDPHASHGAANIGHTTRIVLQITEYE